MNAPIPGVSIIVPAYNCERGIGLLLDSLMALDYPRERLQILVVDNGSTDRTREVAQSYPVTLLEEGEIRSSYAARNRALREAKYDLLAFTDADCVVDPSWIREGVRALESADLAAGKVRFRFSDRPSAAELFDAVSHMQNDDLIRRYSGAATANLFVKAALFKSLGPFRSDIRSGGDMMWTRMAAEAGFSLVYAPGAIVDHPARGLKELLAKGVRLGTGTYRMKTEDGKGRGSMVIDSVRVFFPPRPGAIRRLIERNGPPEYLRRLPGIWFAAYLYRASRGLGQLWGLLGLGGEPPPGATGSGLLRSRDA